MIVSGISYNVNQRAKKFGKLFPRKFEDFFQGIFDFFTISKKIRRFLVFQNAIENSIKFVEQSGPNCLEKFSEFFKNNIEIFFEHIRNIT